MLNKFRLHIDYVVCFMYCFFLKTVNPHYIYLSSTKFLTALRHDGLGETYFVIRTGDWKATRGASCGFIVGRSVWKSKVSLQSNNMSAQCVPFYNNL